MLFASKKLTEFIEYWENHFEKEAEKESQTWKEFLRKHNEVVKKMELNPTQDLLLKARFMSLCAKFYIRDNVEVTDDKSHNKKMDAIADCDKITEYTELKSTFILKKYDEEYSKLGKNTKR